MTRSMRIDANGSVTVRLKDDDWLDSFTAFQSIYIPTAEFCCPQQYVVTTWGKMCSEIKQALKEADLHLGIEAALCEECLPCYENNLLDDYDKYLWRRFIAMRFLQDEVMQVYYPV